MDAAYGDGEWKERTLRLARGVAGRTSPNPAVGAVLVRDGQTVGEGATQPPGGPHAEVVALRAAGDRAQGATLYVTLEPCSHYGRTPPCSDAIITAGVATVHYAVGDPNPRVAGGGARALSGAGVRVVAGEGTWSAAAERLNESFFHWVTHRRPFVIAKWAMSLDGKIATRGGESRWITGAAARRQVHELRDTTDAILVGSGTILADDPALTTRLEGREARHPLRVVLDGRGRLVATARLVAGELPGHTLVATTAASPPAWRAALAALGAAVAVFPPGPHGGADLDAVLDYLGARDVASLLVEGGAGVLASFIEARLVDKYLVFVAPLVIGGAAAPGPVAGTGPELLADAARLRLDAVERIGQDTLLTCYPIKATGLQDITRPGMIQVKPSGQGEIPDRR